MSQAFPVADIPRYAIVATTPGQTALTIPFAFLAYEDIRIVKTAANGAETELVRPTHFSLTGKGNPSGGSATLVTGAASGDVYLILGRTIPTRAQDVTRGGKFSSAAIDEDLDRLNLMVQEDRRDLAQAFRAKFGTTPGAVTVGAAGTIPVWDEAGNLAEGPEAAAIDAIETALAVEAGRALVHGAGGSDPYAAGSRKIAGLADAVNSDEAVTKGQMDTALADLDPADLTARVTKLEQGWLTGDLKFTADPLDQTGWFELNGLSIGSASSNATGRANADTADLFAFFWHATRRAAWSITIQTSAGGASTFGADAATDFAADKRLVLPDLSKRFPRSSGSGLAVGTKEANQNKTHTHVASTGSAGAHQHDITRPRRYGANDSSGGNSNPGWDAGDQQNASSDTKQTASAGAHTHSVTVNADGGSEARPDSFVVRCLARL